MSNNLATIIPAEENAFQLLAEVQQNGLIERELDGFNLTFDRIKIPSGGGTFFEVPTLDGTKVEPAPEMSGVVLYHHPMRSYYKGQYTGGNEKPECYSLDAKSGVGEPGGACGNCPLNEFGSGVNNSKACREKHRVYLLREGEIFPLILDLPTGSIRDFGTYVQRLISKGLNPRMVVTSFSLKKATNSTGIVFSQGVYGLKRILSSEERKLTDQLAQEVAKYATSRNLISDEQEAADYEVDASYAPNYELPFDFDGETGEIKEAV